MPPQPTEIDERKESLIQQAYHAFEQEAAALCPEHCGQWVAYHGSQRIGFGATRAELWQECLQCGLPEGEFWVFDVQPIIAAESLGMGMTKMEYIDN